MMNFSIAKIRANFDEPGLFKKANSACFFLSPYSGAQLEFDLNL